MYGETFYGRHTAQPKNVLFQERLLHFFRANSYSKFLFLIAKNFFNQRLSLLIFFIFFWI